MSIIQKTCPSVIGISGVYGYLGSFLCRFFETKGYRVIRLTHGSSLLPDTYSFNLASPNFLDPFPKLDAFIHCGWDMRLVDWDAIQHSNINGSIALFRHLLDEKVTSLFFISSVAAFETAKSNYGKSKFAVEQFCLNHGITVIRPGLIYDDNPQGILGSLSTLAQKTPILPRVWPSGLQLHLCYLPDIATHIHWLLTCSQNVPITQPLVFAHEEKILFETIIRSFTTRRFLCFISIPWKFIWFLIKIAEWMGLKLRLKSDSLVSLRNQNTDLSFSNTKKYPLKFTAFNRNSIS